MRELLDERRSLVGDDASSSVAADLRFRGAVAAAARNRLLSELYSQLRQSLDAALTDLVDEPELPDTGAPTTNHCSSHWKQATRTGLPEPPSATST
ncbi:FCD domain-containing protein [Pseudonocardia abyssalis]|uniref:FCD domain-containing protein n=1 Tax=Pseudonocardia abyssalis TaxID=2792008 RepID=A0ABS6URJ5_9PSEU|nr:FCD domain-containing protein [Pseudonocardia abyssalis]MBW0114293.1 FCD domain-containing protein [Pseudonocardia abyssalis]MBW0134855.1 FCD domain-containing protein [Pseudonocardia abyssalis]